MEDSAMMDRRQMLASMGSAAAGMAFLNDAVCQDQNPAAQVEDRGSSVKITALRAMVVGAKAYLRIGLRTGGGLAGIEAHYLRGGHLDFDSDEDGDLETYYIGIFGALKF
jgi:hypothetical protein